MKTFKELLLFFAVSLLATAFAHGKEIKLKGIWGTGRSVSLSPIKGNIEEDHGHLQLDFVRDFGNVVVSISDAGGNLVYQQEVLAEEGIPMVVSLKELSVQEGVVSISDGYNTIWGEFKY